jgi:predicted oxidoreductase
LAQEALVDGMLAHRENFVVGDSVAELTDKVQAVSGEKKVDRQAVADAIGQFDEAANLDSGRFDRQRDLIRHVRKYLLDGIRACKDQKNDGRSAYPLIAIKEHIVSRKTLGGLQTSLRSAVLTESGKVLSSLYAIG